VDDEFAGFCRREHARLVAALDLMTGSRPLAEDLAQEALARALPRWSRIREMDAPGAYVHRIAVNLATSSFRRRAAERRLAARAASSDEHRDPDGAISVAVRQALAAIRPQQRRVLVLRYFLGYSVEETADLLGMPAGTVKTHTQRGLSALRAHFDEPVTTGDLEADRA
jgi:RNA polymerase sigma-70 factor (sigma-E family)